MNIKPTNFAFIKENEEVNYITVPTPYSEYEDGKLYPDGVAVAISVKENISNYADKCYNLETKEWYDRPIRPAFHFWKDRQWVFNPEELFGTIRLERDGKLSACDWTQTVDAPLSEEQKTAWANYRQELRDIPSTFSHIVSIDEVIWPVPPA